MPHYVRMCIQLGKYSCLQAGACQTFIAPIVVLVSKLDRTDTKWNVFKSESEQIDPLVEAERNAGRLILFAACVRANDNLPLRRFPLHTQTALLRNLAYRNVDLVVNQVALRVFFRCPFPNDLH